MTKEEIFKAYLQDELLIQKGYLSSSQIENIKYHEKCSSNLVEVIKIAIECALRNESEAISSKTLNHFLNK